MKKTFGSIFSVTKNTFKETIRDRILYVLIFFGLVMIIASQLMIDLSPGAEDKVIVDLGFGIIHLFTILITLFVGTHLIAKETEGKTVMILFSKPLSRSHFIIAKFLGLSGILTLLTIIMGILFSFIAPFEPSYLIILGGILMSSYLLLAIALFFSTFLSPILATFSTLLMFVLGNITDDFFRFVEHAKASISSFFYGTGWMSYHLLPNFENVNFKNSIIHGVEISPIEIFMMFLVTFLYTIFLIWVSMMLFKKREF